MTSTDRLFAAIAAALDLTRPPEIEAARTVIAAHAYSCSSCARVGAADLVLLDRALGDVVDAHLDDAALELAYELQLAHPAEGTVGVNVAGSVTKP